MNRTKNRFLVLKIIGFWILFLACSRGSAAHTPINPVTAPASPSSSVTTVESIVVSQNSIGPYPKTGVTLMTFPLYNGCPDTRTPENADDYETCVDQWLTVTTQHLNDLEVDVFRLPFGADAANQIIGPDLLEPLETRPPYKGTHFTNDTLMIGWPEAETLAQTTGAEVMWVLNVRDICILVCGTGTFERAQTVVQALKGKVRYYELGSEDYRPSLLNQYVERVNRFGGMIQQEDPQAFYAAVLRDDYVWFKPFLPPTPYDWQDRLVALPGPHHLQRHLFFPTGDRLKFHRIGAEFSFPLTVTQAGAHTLSFAFDEANSPNNVEISVGSVALQWTGSGFTGDLQPGVHPVIITSKTNSLVSMKFVFDLIEPDGNIQRYLSGLEGKSGWELYMAGAHGIGDDFIPQEIGNRKVWVSEISEHAVSPAVEADGRSGHRWLDALAYASGFMRAASHPQVEIILGHTLYEVAWNGMVAGVGRTPWEEWESLDKNLNPKPRPKFWVHQQMAQHMKHGQQLEVQMPIEHYELDGGIQMGYSGREAQQVPLVECWGSDLGVKKSLLCINRSFDQSFNYAVQFEGSEATTAQMVLLTGQPGDHNEGDTPMVEPQIQTTQLSNVVFPPRSLVRLEINQKESNLYLPVVTSGM